MRLEWSRPILFISFFAPHRKTEAKKRDFSFQGRRVALPKNLAITIALLYNTTNSAVQNNFEHMFATPPQFNLVMGDDRRAPSRRCCEGQWQRNTVF